MRKNDIMFLLAENSRIRLKDISKLLGKSSQQIKYNFRVFEKQGLIYNPYCIFDYSYFGLVLFRVYFRNAYISEKDKANIISELDKNNYIVSIYELNGEYDLVIELLAPNPSRFNKVLKEIISLVPTLRHYKVVLNLVSYLFPRLYLTKDNRLKLIPNERLIIGGDRNVEEFNERELGITKALLLKPKIQITKLAKEASINVKTAKSVLKDLQDREIIRGFKYMINQPKLEIFKSRLFLKLHNLTKERELELIGHLQKNENIVQANKTVGDWDIEIDIESFNKTKIREVTNLIREEFSDIIETFNIIEFYQSFKKSYLPNYLFEK